MNLPGLSLLQSEFASLRPLQKWLAGLAFLVLLAERLWFLFQYPIHTDEAYTFTHFTNGGIWRSMSYYPLPNNHIFFSVITAAFHYLIPDAFWSLRLPALLIGVGVTVFLFLAVRRLAGFWVALLGVGLFCFSNLGIYYSFHARGYFLMTGLSAAAAFALLHFIRTGYRPALWWFGLASVLGFYTVPVFLYPFVALAGFGFILLLVLGDRKRLAGFILAGLGVGLATLLLYLPVFAVSGFQAVAGNEYVSRLAPGQFRDLFLPRLQHLENTLVGREPEGYLLALAWLTGNLLVLGYYLKKAGRQAWKNFSFQWAWLMVWLPAGAVLTLVVQQVLPDARIWLYLSFFQFTGLAWLLFRVAGKVNLKKGAMGLALILLGFYAAHQARVLHTFRQTQMKIYAQFPKVVDMLMQTRPERVFVQHSFYSLFTEYAYAKQNRHLEVEAKYFDPRVTYDFIILDKDLEEPANLDLQAHRFYYQDDFVVVYRKI